MIPPPDPVPEDSEHWETWFGQWSLPLASITDAHAYGFIEHVASTALDGTKRRLASSSLKRTRAVVRAAFTNAYKRRLIEWDPWAAVEGEALRDGKQVDPDPDLVMDPDEVRRLAQACASIDRRYEAFVLIQGLCGLRPGEAVELRRRDLVVVGGEPIAITVRATHSAVPDRFFTEGETRKRPLKGRGVRASRTVPVPVQLRPLLARHVSEFVEGSGVALVFTNPKGGRINLSNFHRDVWRKAREAVFEEDSPLRRVRRHDLRHAAITAWLNAGVPLKTAQTWSGHRTASVLLDTYLGVIKGDDLVGLGRFESLIEVSWSSHLVTVW